MRRILSMGAGVQTTALLIKCPERYKDGYIVFADTGDEKAKTYWYIEKYLKPFCEEKNLKWVTVKNKNYDSLMDWSMKKKRLPIVMSRHCTKNFKITPMEQYARSIGATDKNPIYLDIGISIDESHRANFTKYEKKYLIKEWPLVDLKISRKMCYDIIKEHGWPLPVKSGCDFCPFMPRSEMKKLSYENPERFAKIVAMEKNDTNYPKYPLNGRYTLESISNNTVMDDFTDDEDENATCDSGHCFV